MTVLRNQENCEWLHLEKAAPGSTSQHLGCYYFIWENLLSSGWIRTEAKWEVKNGVFVREPATTTKRGLMISSCIWMVYSPNITGKSRARGSSGIFLQRYELQVWITIITVPYANGQVGIYNKRLLLKRYALPGSGTFIIYTAPFQRMVLYFHLRVTVIHNGVIIKTLHPDNRGIRLTLDFTLEIYATWEKDRSKVTQDQRRSPLLLISFQKYLDKENCNPFTNE